MVLIFFVMKNMGNLYIGRETSRAKCIFWGFLLFRLNQKPLKTKFVPFPRLFSSKFLISNYVKISSFC